MRQLFLRLTITFWLLYLYLVVSTGVSFYFEYEQNLSQKVAAIDGQVSNVGERITTELNRIQKLQETVISVIEGSYQQSLSIYEHLSNEELANLINEDEFSLKSRDEKIEKLAYEYTIANIENFLYQQSNLLSTEKFSFLTLEQFEADIDDLEFRCQLREDRESSLFCSEIHDEGLDKLYLAEALVLEETILGYINVELVSAANLIYEYENNVYYLVDNIKIFPDHSLILRNDQINLSPDSESFEFNVFVKEEKNFFDETTLEEATKILQDNGYHVSVYDSEIGNYKMLNYMSLSEIQREVIRESLTIFKVSLILSISLFAVVFYFVFKSVIQPCYLLVDYVRRCGERDYLIIPNLNDRWRLTFLSVRDAYLENERLLAEKDKQSEELQVAWKRAIDASKAKSHFLAKISHELKTPLNAIKGYAQLLRRSLKDEKQKKQVDIIHHSSELLLKLVNELLDFSVIEEGKVKLQVNQLDLRLVAHEIEELFAIQANSKNLEFHVIVDPEVPDNLYGDGNRIKQVVINLTSNAIKFTENGYITVSIDLDYQTETDAYIKIQVKDTGKGIKESKFLTVFESFTQENDSISQQFGGTGLGLSISKQLAEIMGGNLTLESEIGVGTTFIFFLPLSKISVEERALEFPVL